MTVPDDRGLQNIAYAAVAAKRIRAITALKCYKCIHDNPSQINHMGNGVCLSPFAEQTDMFLEQAYSTIAPDEAEAVLMGGVGPPNCGGSVNGA
jgi:hypothetical protein